MSGLSLTFTKKLKKLFFYNLTNKIFTIVSFNLRNGTLRSGTLRNGTLRSGVL